MGRGRASRFRYDDTLHCWIGRDAYYAGERLTVVRDAGGQAVALNLGTFIFARTPYDPAAPVPGVLDPSGWHGRPDAAAPAD